MEKKEISGELLQHIRKAQIQEEYGAMIYFYMSKRGKKSSKQRFFRTNVKR